MKSVRFLFIVSVLFSPFLMCSNSPHAGEEEEGNTVVPSEMDVHVSVAQIQEGSLPVILKAMGTFVPKKQSPSMLVPRIPGVIADVEVKDGQEVNAGDVIIRLDDRIAKNALMKTQAGLNLANSALNQAVNGGLDSQQADLDLAAHQAEIAAQQAQLEADRQTSLLEDHLTSEKAVLDAKQALILSKQSAQGANQKAEYFRTKGRSEVLAGLKATVEQAQSEVMQAKLDMDSMIIRAPHAGRISGLNGNAGASVDDKTLLAQVIGGQGVLLRLWLSNPDTELLYVGADVTAQSSPFVNSCTGTVVSIGGELDPDIGLVPVEVQINSSSSHSPRIGEAVYAEIATARKSQGFLVPLSALIVEDDKASVFSVDANQIAQRIPVEIVCKTMTQALISTADLQEGSKIIVDGNYNLPDGAHVVEDGAQ